MNLLKLGTVHKWRHAVFFLIFGPLPSCHAFYLLCHDFLTPLPHLYDVIYEQSLNECVRLRESFFFSFSSGDTPKLCKNEAVFYNFACYWPGFFFTIILWFLLKGRLLFSVVHLSSDLRAAVIFSRAERAVYFRKFEIFFYLIQILSWIVKTVFIGKNISWNKCLDY